MRNLDMGLLFFLGGAKVSINALRIKNKVIRLITGLKRLVSFRQKFKENGILTVTSIYILDFLYGIEKHRDYLKNNREIHDHNTRSKHDLHTQSHNTSQLQKSVMLMEVRLYKQVPWSIKS